MDDDTPQTFQFDSSAIASAVYSPRDRTVSITFTHGGVKTYQGFGAKDWNDLTSAPSAGNHYNTFIRGLFSPA